MNQWVGGPALDAFGSWRPRNQTGWLVYLKASDMNAPGPSQTFVLLDEREDSINDGHFALDMTGFPDQPSLLRILNFPASYHNRAGGLSFADGHSEIKRWLDVRTMPKLSNRDRLRDLCNCEFEPGSELPGYFQISLRERLRPEFDLRRVEKCPRLFT